MFDQEIKMSLEYLNSKAAQEALLADPYWPKWNSPWWHMLLLHEMGKTSLIPESTIRDFVSSLDRIPLKIFPIFEGELPLDIDPFRGTPCHCQLGNVYQVLSEWGVNVDHTLPWIRPWFLKYQMPDGGMNCDNSAYLVKGECPSSMVGTIAAFEAVLYYTPRPWTKEEKDFLEKGAHFLMSRRLTEGSKTHHNTEEQVEALEWEKMCFPRFYFYDTLRGLSALMSWAEKTSADAPIPVIKDIYKKINAKFGEGPVRVERKITGGIGTLQRDEDGNWFRAKETNSFALLDKVSVLGRESEFLSEKWKVVRSRAWSHFGEMLQESI